MESEKPFSDMCRLFEELIFSYDLDTTLTVLARNITEMMNVKGCTIEIDFISALASGGAVAIENARLFEHVKKEYDELTRDVWKWYDWWKRFPKF